MSRRSEEQEYPTEDHENGNRAAEDHQPVQHDEEDDAVSMTSSQADRKALEEEPGVDFRAPPSEAHGFYVMVFYNIFAFISFAFMLTASCPVPWISSSSGQKWTIWKNNEKVEWKSVACDHKRQMFQAMEAFSIISCVLSLVALITGVLQMTGRGHLGVTMLVGVVTTVCTLTDWALIVNQYHKYNCPDEPSYVNDIGRLNAGFCLTFISFALMFFGVVALTAHINSAYKLSELRAADYKGAALASAALTGALTVISVVGTAFTMWEEYYTTYTIKITLWHVEQYDRGTGLSQYWSLKDYHCSAFTSMMKAGAAFAIISDVFLFATFLIGIGAVYNRACKWVTVGLGCATFIFLLICSAILLATRFKYFCRSGATFDAVPNGSTDVQQVRFKNFVITEGLGMIIASWCLMAVNMIYLIVKG